MIKLRLHCTIFLTVIITITLFCFKADIVIFPKTDSNNCIVYSDSISKTDKGNSVINYFNISTEKITLDYTLKNKVLYPYAGIQWYYHPDQFLDLTEYDNLVLTIDPDSTTVKNILVMLQIFCDDFSDTSNTMTWRFLTKELYIQKGISTYSIPLSNFITPDWWYKRFNTSEHELGKPDLGKVGQINIQSSTDTLDKSNRIVISEIKICRPNWYRLFIISLGILFIYIIILFGIRIKSLSNKRKETIPAPYEKIQVQDCAVQDEKTIIGYIGKNYCNAELSLLKMSTDIGIPTYKISEIIKQKHSLSFKQYLNTIRISEAKRLLKTSDLQISQIAYRVGYGTAPHFNRIFKELTSLSPNAYRNNADM